MKEYMGLFFSEQTPEIDQIINKLISDEEKFFYHSRHLFLTSQTEFLNNENFFVDDEAILLFSGHCFNQEELVELSGLEDRFSFAEVLKTLYRQHDRQFFQKIRGYFTLLIYDKLLEEILMIRDHFGVQSLFYNQIKDGILFSNTKKEILELIDDHKVDCEALQHYLSFQYVTDPLTMSENIYFVPSGNYIEIDRTNKINKKVYFKRTFHPIFSDKSYLINRIRDALFDSVCVMMDQRASIGTFLSGGIDSTLITSIAKEINPKIKTFSVGFEQEGYSEIEIAKKSAEYLDVENIAKIISSQEYVESLPEIIWHLEDPLADPSCVPLFFVAREAKKHVECVLSGEGADEFFGGYNIYREPESLKVFNYVPSIMKKQLNKIVKVLPEGVKGKNFLERGTTPLEERYIGNAKIFDEQEKRAFLVQYDEDVTYRKVTQPFFNQVQEEPLTTQMQYIDIHTWLPGDILLKANKMAKANSLTILMPFIDINVFKIASELPVSLSIAKRTTKLLLRDAARGIVPDHVLHRKKLGFPVPINQWLKDELYDWAKTLIKESETEQLIYKGVVLDMLDQHASGKKDLSRKLWTLLIFMLWHQIFIEKKYNFQKATGNQQ